MFVCVHIVVCLSKLHMRHLLFFPKVIPTHCFSNATIKLLSFIKTLKKCHPGVEGLKFPLNGKAVLDSWTRTPVFDNDFNDSP